MPIKIEGISVVIRTSNSRKSLGILLRHLKIGPNDEMLVVDTGSVDGTTTFAESAGARVIHNLEPFNYSRTLNLGFATAKNEWLLALSSHCVPINEDFLNQYRATLTHFSEEPAVIYGMQVFSRRQYARMNKVPLSYRGKFTSQDIQRGSNSNALYSRGVWLKHPFDEALSTGEDLEWRRWAEKSGLMCVIAPKACVQYRHTAGLRYRFQKGRSEAQVTQPEVVPMTLRELVLGAIQATRRLLWEERAVREWLGQLAHQLGAFAGSRIEKLPK